MSAPEAGDCGAGVGIPEEWKAADSCAVSDALDAFGYPGVVCGVVPLVGDARIIGRVVTVELGPIGDMPPSDRHLGTAAVEEARAGDVIVVAHRGRTDCAGWGGNLSLASKRGGIAGVIVDGACRDVSEAAAVNFPVFARSATPRTARGRVCEFSYQQPIVFDEVVVKPGDLVVADANGVVFVHREWEASVMASAVRIVQKEAAMAVAINSGTRISEVMGADYERIAN